MVKPTRIFLVGPMGVGKTTIGRELAKKLSLTFIDVDEAIEQRLGVSISWIFDIEGEAGFRAREKSILDELTEIPSVLLATGGGAVLDPDNRRCMQQRGVVVYLHASVKTLYRRTRHDTSRPLLQTGNRFKCLETLLLQRDPLYRETADIIIESDGKTAKQVSSRVLKKLMHFEG